MAKGNDDLLFGQPNDLEEAAETLLAFYGEERLKEFLQGGISAHGNKPLYGMAEFIRNHWFLWWHEQHGSKWFPESKPPLLSFFHDAGVTHPDDMTDIIFSFLLHRFNDQPYDLAETVACLQAYWKEQGYPNGKPDSNAF